MHADFNHCIWDLMKQCFIVQIKLRSNTLDVVFQFDTICYLKIFPEMLSFKGEEGFTILINFIN